MISNSPYKPGSIERGGFSLRGTASTIIPCEPLQVPLGQRQLIMSRAVMEDYYDCTRTVYAVEKHPENPLISSEKPWEQEGPTGNGSVLYDARLGKFRLWTQIWNYPQRPRKKLLVGSIHRVPSLAADRDFHLVYYESDDGIEWQRPTCGQHEYEGSKENNIIDIGPFMPATVHVMGLPESHRDRGRFAMLMAGLRDQPLSEDDHRMEQFLYFSEDGTRWTLPTNNFFRGRCDCHQPIVWNPERGVFMYYRRMTVNAKEIRRIAYTESTDLVQWTQPRLIIGTDELDTLYLYGMAVSRYQNMYLGLLQNLYAHADYDRVKVPKASEIDIQLAWSRDGMHWDRHPQRPIFIPTGPLRAGVPDWGMVHAMNDILDVGDRVHVYYCGTEGLHTSVVPGRTRHICLGTLRRDGFVSLDAPREGWALTAPLRCPGGKLHINAATDADGVIQVAIREGEGVRDGEWPEAWSLDHATDFTGDAIDHEVDWKGQTDLSPWKDKTIRLEFRIVKARLYSFWFV